MKPRSVGSGATVLIVDARLHGVAPRALRSEAPESQRYFVQKVVHGKREYVCG